MCHQYLQMIVFAVSVLASTLAAQASGPIIGSEIFITADGGQSPGSEQRVRNIVFRTADGQQESVTFMFGASVVMQMTMPFPIPVVPHSAGTFGLRYLHGAYLIEPFYLTSLVGTSTSFLLMGTDCFPCVPPGPSLCCTRYASIPLTNANERIGYRFSRLDGGPFSLVSFEYSQASADFQVGTSLVTFLDFQNFARFAPASNLPTYQTLTFPVVTEILPTEMHFSVAPGASLLVLNPSTSAFSVNGVVTEIRYGDGSVVSNPGLDPLVGGTLQLSGLFLGIDLARLSNVSFSAGTQHLWTDQNGGTLNVQQGFAPGPAEWRLGGPLSVQPELYRHQSGLNFGTYSVYGGTSPALRGLSVWGRAVRFGAIYRIGAGGTQVVAIHRTGFPAPPSGAERNFTTDGNGRALVGLVDVPPNAEFHHFVDMNPLIPLGQGPFFGINFSGDQIAQIQLPLGLHPLHARADTDGTYFWGTPSGILPPFLTVDVVLVVRTTPTFTASPPQRVTF